MAATQNTETTTPATEGSKAPEVKTDTQPAGLAALIAASVAQGAQAAAKPASRTKKNGYGVFTLVPEGFVVRVRYDSDGRELASWELVLQAKADGTPTLGLVFGTKKAALAWVDSVGYGKPDAVIAEARKIIAAAKK